MTSHTPAQDETAHLERRFVLRAPAPPDRVFPLLCPVRELDWVDGWAAEIVRSESGTAELGCVFRTGPFNWVVHAYAPPERIGFTIVQADQLVELLDVTLEPDGDDTLLTWRRVVTALGPEGRHTMASWADAWDSLHEYLERALAHHLRTGGLLPK